MSTETTIQKTFTIGNEFGIHARPAAMLVKCASKYLADVQIGRDGIMVSGKSIMGLLTLEAHHGCEIDVVVIGEDAEDAIKALAELFADNFGE